MTRFSRQREAVLSKLRSVKTHPTATMVYDMVRNDIPNISMGTVYRNLSELSSRGEILTLSTGDGVARFDGDTSRHYHFYCSKCNKLYDIPHPPIDGIETQAGVPNDFLVNSHNLMFYGICGSCNGKTGEDDKNQAD